MLGESGAILRRRSVFPSQDCQPADSLKDFLFDFRKLNSLVSRLPVNEPVGGKISACCVH